MSPCVFLAKSAVESFIKDGEIISPPDDLPKEFLERKSGTFVTIERRGNLRGCVGTYLPSKENIAAEIIQNAISAATHDYRFGPVEETELPELSYKIYILSEPKPVKDISKLNPKKFGIIVKSQGFSSTDIIFNPAPRPYQKTGILLPDLKEIDTVEKQISIACQKGGIDQNSEKIIIYRFTVKKYT